LFILLGWLLLRVYFLIDLSDFFQSNGSGAISGCRLIEAFRSAFFGSIVARISRRDVAIAWRDSW